MLLPQKLLPQTLPYLRSCLRRAVGTVVLLHGRQEVPVWIVFRRLRPRIGPTRPVRASGGAVGPLSGGPLPTPALQGLRP